MIGEEGQKENEKMKGRGKKGREGGASCGEKAMQQSEVQNVMLREYLRKEGCHLGHLLIKRPRNWHQRRMP